MPEPLLARSCASIATSSCAVGVTSCNCTSQGPTLSYPSSRRQSLARERVIRGHSGERNGDSKCATTMPQVAIGAQGLRPTSGRMAAATRKPQP